MPVLKVAKKFYPDSVNTGAMFGYRVVYVPLSFFIISLAYDHQLFNINPFAIDMNQLNFGVLFLTLFIKHMICGNNYNWVLNLNLIYETWWTGAGSGLLILMVEKPNWFLLTDLTTLVLLMLKWILLFLRKNHLLDAFCFFLIGIHSMQGWTATTRHGVTRKRSTKRLKHTGSLFRKNLQLIGVC